MAICIASGCGRQERAAPTVSVELVEPSPSATSPVPVSAGAVVGAELLPTRGGVTGYVGSDACRECHAEQHASWRRSYHRTMTQWPTPEAVQANFNHVVLTNDRARYVLSRQSNDFWVRIESAFPPEPGQAVPEPVEVPLGLVTGSHHMQVFWVGNGAGNTQIGFPFTWLIPEKRWVPRNSTFLRPPEMPLRTEVWNIVCSRCHATGPEPHIDRVNRAFNTRVAELGISCEACHGPGEKHLALARTLPKAPIGSTPQPRDLAVVHPEKIDPTRSSQICGACHSMKWFDHQTGWGDNGFAYRPGDDLEKTTPVIRAAATNRTPALTAYLERNPSLLADFFWPDGMIRVSGREYNGLIESPCYGKPRNGKSFGCISCHALHDGEPDDQLAPDRRGNRACLPCHEAFRNEAALTAHTHHLGESSGSDCANCHQPHTTYGVLKAIRSHQISSPDVGVELATGRPNACNLCHLDRSLGWTAKHLAAWYGRPEPSLEPATAQVADSIRLALTGDAGQRVLIAWHLGWPEAVRVSGTNGFGPVMEQLLRDPYSAVRCVAERSARMLGLKLRADYDFTASPSGEREALAQPIAPPGAEAFLRLAAVDGGASSVQSVLTLWLQQRNNRDVRLRE